MNFTPATSHRLSHVSAFRLLVARFLWKEQRTVRPLAVGIAALGTAILVLATSLMPQRAVEVVQVAVPWGAGALLALGAAISMFATERDEQTDDFLKLLPRHEWPVLIGKMFAVAGLSLGMVVLLGLVGVVTTGGRLPSGQLIASASVAGLLVVVEWLVWGIAASLLCSNPLLAPVIAIAAAALGAELAFAASSASEASLWFASEVAAPQRLLVVAAVLLVDLRLGLRWLDPRPSGGPRQRRFPSYARKRKPLPRVDAPSIPNSFPSFRRLAWQSWREGWLPMLAVLPVGLFLTASFSAVAEGVARATESVSVAPLGWLFLPALCGALAFRADQRARQYAYLNVHAAPPVAVWAARQTMWLAVAMVIGLALDVAILRGSALGWPAIIAAYGCGQFFSMMIRSSVLASFAAMASSLVIAAWSHAVDVWQLPPFWFVGALGLATLAATLAGCRSWLKDAAPARRGAVPAVVLAAGLALALFAFPIVRSSQVYVLTSSSTQSSLDEILGRWDSEKAAAEAVAAEYRRFTTELHRKHDEFASSGSEIDADQVTFLAACEHEFDELARLSLAPRCRMPSATVAPAQRNAALKTIEWLGDDAARLITVGDLELALTRLITARRMAAHAAQYQPLSGRLNDAERAAAVPREDQLLRWSIAPGQTHDLMTDAIQRLCACEPLEPALSDAIVADYLHIRSRLASRSIVDSAVTRPAADVAPAWFAHLASFAHRLPGEQTRALAALKQLTEARLAYVAAVAGVHALPSRSQPTAVRVDELKRLLHPGLDRSAGLSRTPREIGRSSQIDSSTASQAQRAIAASETSLRPALELAYSGSVVDAMISSLDRRARRSAEIVRVALIAHRLEHGTYPESLAALTTARGERPSYLPSEAIIDPYAGAPIQYRPQGLELPLQSHDEATLADMIQPGTPHLWSVGSTFVRPADVWVAETRTDDGKLALVRANDPARHPPSPHGDVPVHIAKFYSGVDFAGRGPILLTLPE